MPDDLSIEDRMAQLMASYDDEDDEDTDDQTPESEEAPEEEAVADASNTPAPQGDWWSEIEKDLPDTMTPETRAAVKDKLARERDRVAGTLGQRMQSLQNEYNALQQRINQQSALPHQTPAPSEADEIPQETADLLAEVILRRSKYGQQLRDVMDNHVPKQEVELAGQVNALASGQYKDVPEFMRFVPTITQVIRQYGYDYQNPALLQTVQPILDHLNELAQQRAQSKQAPAKTPARRVRGVEQPGPSGRTVSGLPRHTDDMGEIIDMVVRHV